MSSKSKYLWLILIEYFEHKNYIHNGLTLPFLIGAIQMLTGKLYTVSEIITEMTNDNNIFITTIFKCGNIGEFVIGIMDSESEQYYKQYPKNIFKYFSNFIFLDSSFDNIVSQKDFIDYMEARYNWLIANHKFSINNGIWTYFTDVEQKRILEVSKLIKSN